MSGRKTHLRHSESSKGLIVLRRRKPLVRAKRLESDKAMYSFNHQTSLRIAA